MRLRVAALIVTAHLFVGGAGTLASESSSLPVRPLSDAQIVAQLRKGGHVLYLRHTSTDLSRNDAAMRSFEDCENQRNLTDKGRDEARAIGAHLKRLRIPIGAVLASPYCRTMETAGLAFGKAEATNEVRGGPLAADDPQRYAPLRKLLGSRPAKSTNTAISSHGNPFRAVAGAPYLEEGELAVLKPLGDGRFAVIARIKKGDWETLPDPPARRRKS